MLNIVAVLMIFFMTSFIPVKAQETGELELKQTVESEVLIHFGAPNMVQLYFYDKDDNILTSEFNTDSSKYPTVTSGSILELVTEQNIIILGIPEGTKYRVRMISVLKDLEMSEIEKTGTIKANQKSVADFFGKETDFPSYIYPSFNTEVLGKDFPNNHKFVYEIKFLTEGKEKFVDYPKTITTYGPGITSFPIQINGNGTFRFSLKQIGTEGDGIILDDNEYEIEIYFYHVETTRESITYFLNDSPLPDDTIPEFENEKLTPVTYEPEVKKILTGDEASKNKFTFELKKVDDPKDNAELPKKTEITLEGNKEAKFDPITFNSEGIYKFSVSEVKKNIFGYSYDTDPWELRVEVINTDEGLKVKEAKYTRSTDSSSDQATFNNIYHSGSLKITKNVIGKENDDTNFKFKISLKNTNGEALQGEYPTDKEDLKISDQGSFFLKDNESITISKLPVDTQYTLEEEELPHGYTPIIDKSTGKILENNEIEVLATNNYIPDSITYSPKVTKTLTGIDESSESFEFTITSISENKGVSLPENTIITGRGTNEFDPITFTEAGIFNFEISEINSGISGYTYDTGKWNLTVIVEDNNGYLEVKSHDYSRDSQSSTEEATFINSYLANPTEITPMVHKDISGDAPNDQKTFSFNLEPYETLSDGSSFTSTDSITVDLNNTSEASFNTISFTKTGNYKFKITEVNDSKLGFDYDDNTWILEVIISDVNAQLTSSVRYYKENNEEESNELYASFTNIYNSQSLTISKTVPNKETDEDFTFRVNFKGSDDVPMTSRYPVEGSNLSIVDIAHNETFTLKKDQTITIKNLPVGLKYSITEETLPNGYINSFENNSGTIVKDQDISINCINTYSPKKVEYQPIIEKVISNQTPPENHKFNFTLIPDKTANNPVDGDNIGESLTASIEGAGDVTISSIEFTKEGTYSYLIYEIQDEVTGYVYDSSIYKLVVVVSDEDAELNITNATYYKGEDPIELDKAQFDNIYAPIKVTYKPMVNKVVEGAPPQDSIFNFIIEFADNYEDTVLSEPSTLQITGNNTGEFAPITFGRAGIFKFYIKEIQGEELGYSYDDSVWELEVNVTDNKGKLEISTTTYSVIDKDLLEKQENQQTNDSEMIEVPEDDLEAEIENLTEEIQSQEDSLIEEVGLNISNNFINQSSVKTNNLIQLITKRIYDLTKNSIDYGISGGGPVRAAPEPLIKELTTTEKTASFTNTYESGSINLTKVVTGEITDETFTFSVELRDSEENLLPGRFNIGNNITIGSNDFIYLKNNQSVLISGIPLKSNYFIKEITDPNKYDFVETLTGTIDSEETINLTAVNKTKNINTGSIRVTKTLKNETSDKSFNFTLRVYDLNGNESDENFLIEGQHLIKSGSMFSLKNNESVIISEIPEGFIYEVIEEDNKNYSVISTNATGDIKFDEVIEVNFINQAKNNFISAFIPKTGDDSNMGLIRIGLIGVGIITLILLYIRFRKGKENRD